MRLYYHKTDGGAEYLFDTFIECPNGHKEGTITDRTRYIVRIDGDIEEDAELTVRDSAPVSDVRSMAGSIAAEIIYRQMQGGEELDEDEIEHIVEDELRKLNASKQLSN